MVISAVDSRSEVTVCTVVMSVSELGTNELDNNSPTCDACTWVSTAVVQSIHNTVATNVMNLSSWHVTLLTSFKHIFTAHNTQ